MEQLLTIRFHLHLHSLKRKQQEEALQFHLFGETWRAPLVIAQVEENEWKLAGLCREAKGNSWGNIDPWWSTELMLLFAITIQPCKTTTYLPRTPHFQVPFCLFFLRGNFTNTWLALDLDQQKMPTNLTMTKMILSRTQSILQATNTIYITIQSQNYKGC